jgi:large subunit ribosomal protein L15
LQDLFEAKLIKKMNATVKILADGELSKACNISAHKVSANAKAKIEALGGKINLL